MVRSSYNLKNILKKFLSKEETTFSKLSLCVSQGKKSTMVIDKHGNFFDSEKVAQLFKKENIKSKKIILTLNDWSFSCVSKKVDFKIDDYETNKCEEGVWEKTNDLTEDEEISGLI